MDPGLRPLAGPGMTARYAASRYSRGEAPNSARKVRVKFDRSSNPTSSAMSVTGAFVAASDFVRQVPEMIARWVPGGLFALGTDGFGRSDTREALRIHFEVSPQQIAYAALHGLCLTGEAGRDELVKAIAELGIDPERIDPREA